SAIASTRRPHCTGPPPAVISRSPGACWRRAPTSMARATAHELGGIGWASCFRQGHAAFAGELLAPCRQPPIFARVALGREDLVRALVGRDRSLLGSLKMSRFEHERTPLHLAVLKDRPAMVRLLLELGADPRARDSRGYTPLNFARPQTDPAVADLLVAAGAQPTERNVNRFEHLAPVLNVGSVATSVDYYVEKLGFRKLFDWGAPPTFASVGRDEVKIFLSRDDWGGPSALSIFVQDVDGLYEDYRARGAVIRRPPTDLPWGVRAMDIEDPDGHRLRFSGDGGEENRTERAT